MKLTALVLAGGEGKRFSPIICNKPLFPFMGKPIIEYTLISLEKAGFREAVIVTNPVDQEQIHKIKLKKLKITTAIQESAKGMADAVLSAKNLIKGKSIFILNAEDFVEQELIDKAFSKINTNNSNNFIIAKKLGEYFKGGYLKFKGNRLSGIIEKPKEGKQPSKFINLVFHYFVNADEFLENLTKTKKQKDDVYERALSEIIRTNKVEVIKYQGSWQALKYPWHILDMTKLYLQQRLESKISKSAKIHASAIIQGSVRIEDKVRICENAVIKGPSYIGPNSIIGNSALVIESMIEADCVIGFITEVTRSYIGNGCWLHRNYVGDSVLEQDNFFGAGAVTANFRFDENSIHSQVKDKKIDSQRTKFGSIIGQRARVGINSSLMPGVKIGDQAIVGPGVVQYRDLNPNEKSFESS